MDKSANYGFYLPSKDSDDVVDINQISDNFRNIDENILSKQDVDEMLKAKQDTLASGINIKTINHQTILGEGNIDIENEIEVDQIYNPESDNPQSGTAVAEAVATHNADQEAHKELFDKNKQYTAATFANTLKGTASGEVIRLDDVSPVEHEVNVTLESVNLAVPNEFVVENNGMTATTNPDGTITVTGSVADGTKATLLQLIYREHEANFIALELGQIYKLVVKKDGTSILTFGTKIVYTDTGEVYWGTVETTDITRPRKVQLVYLQKNVAEGDTSLCGTYTVQLVKGTKVGEYTPYVNIENVTLTVNGNTYSPEIDGTVKGVVSASPTMTFITDTAGVTINCEYNRDINAAFAELQQAIISFIGEPYDTL